MFARTGRDGVDQDTSLGDDGVGGTGVVPCGMGSCGGVGLGVGVGPGGDVGGGDVGERPGVVNRQ
jgi:hypothetical protein